LVENSCIFGMVKICKCLCDKGIKIFKKFDFCAQLPAHLVDFFTAENAEKRAKSTGFEGGAKTDKYMQNKIGGFCPPISEV